MKKILLLLLSGISVLAAKSQMQSNPGSNHANRFEELNYLLSTPNAYRTASGAPGPQYWQQRADYDISVEPWVKSLALVTLPHHHRHFN